MQGLACRPWIVLSSSTGSTLRALWAGLSHEAKEAFQGGFTDRPCGSSGALRELAPQAPVYESSKDKIEAECVAWLGRKKFNDPLILCCGYFRILSSDFIKNTNAVLVNTHPSLLPAFPGLDKKVHESALANACISGFSLHVVNEQLDGGPVLFQAPVPIAPQDTVDTLRERVRRAEQAWLPVLWDRLLRSDLRPEDRHSNAHALRARMEFSLDAFVPMDPPAPVGKGRPPRV